MKRSTMLFAILLTVALFSAACAPQAAPTPSLADLQGTAMANAQAQIALTAAAMPTATQIPTLIPTTIPAPILPPAAAGAAPTVVVIQPQSAAPVLPAATAPAATAKSKDYCKTSTVSGMKGPHANVTFVTSINGVVDEYFYIYKTVFGCGYGHVNLAGGNSTTVSIPVGCYDFYGWVNGPKPSTSSGYACFQKDQPATVRINAKSIAVKLNTP